jgi:uncharacterized protein DUF6600/FecR-like protein
MMGTMARTPLRTIALLAVCLVSGLASAQDNEPYAADPPERAARLSYISGDVSLQPAGEEQWAPAIVNRPLTTGDKLWTEQNARAEIYVGPAAVRLDDNTGFSFLNVDDDTIQMRVTAGVISVSVLRLEGGEHIEIDTPNVALSLLRAGNYRVEVNDAGDATVVKVSEGEVQATGPSQDIVVHAQQAVTFTGVDDLVAQHRSLGAPDEFDSWSLERDRYDERAASSRTAEYVSPEVTGYQDLDDNGTWSSEPEYGYVWTPRYVAVDWAPYRYGRWVWISPWGYTWIDDARWGYAPFHYGRWAHVRNRWCWVPGPRHVRAVYAPALVGWGGSSGAHVSWFPLGPREIYVPRRRYSHRYFERVNDSNTVIVSRNHITEAYVNAARNTVYRNRSMPGGVTGASRATFTNAGRVGNQRVRFSEPELARGSATAVAPRIEPGRESRMGGPSRANVRVPPRSIADRQVVVRRDPPPAAARFARAPKPREDVAQTPVARSPRPPTRGLEPGESTGRAALVRDRPDRPARVERPAGESTPPSQSSVFDRRALADRVRQDRDRQVRDGQQQREAEHQRREVEQNQQRDAAARQRWEQLNDQARRQREQSQAVRQQQHQERERVQRQPDVVRQSAPRTEPREQPAPRERSAERPQVQRPQEQRQEVQRSQAERPRSEPSNRSEGRRSGEPKSHSNR